MARNVRNDQILSPTNQQSDACVPTWPDSLMFWPFLPFLPLQDKKKKDLGNKKPKHCSRVDFASLFTKISYFADSKIFQALLTSAPLTPRAERTGKPPLRAREVSWAGLWARRTRWRRRPLRLQLLLELATFRLVETRVCSLERFSGHSLRARVLRCSGNSRFWTPNELFFRVLGF